MSWLSDAIKKALGLVEKEYPGFTNQIMMDAAGPMEEPRPDPRQYDPPYRVPYGEDKMIRKRDLERPLGISSRLGYGLSAALAKGVLQRRYKDVSGGWLPEKDVDDVMYRAHRDQNIGGLKGESGMGNTMFGGHPKHAVMQMLIELAKREAEEK